MTRVELAKIFGLEEDCIPTAECFRDGKERFNIDTEAGFCVGSKYFKVLAYTVDEAWEKAAEKLLSDIAVSATAHYSNQSMY